MTKPQIAIVPASGLGDGLVMLVLAHNLQRNNYDVTFYSDKIYELRDRLPTIKVKPYPHKKELISAFTQYNLLIAVRDSILINFATQQDCILAKHCIFIVLPRNPDKTLSFDYRKCHAQSFIKINNSEQIEKLIRNLQIIPNNHLNPDKKYPIAEQIFKFCQYPLKLNNVIKDCGLQISHDLIHHKYPNRIIIHPTSRALERNWTANKFIKLAKILEKHGWQPVFCVSPSEWPEWQQKLNNSFLLPKFPTVSDLVAFIYESGFMIGNDSGTGHLASSLKIPTLTILARVKFQPWIPNLHLGKVVTPAFKLPISHRSFWPYLISVRKVFKAFKDLVKNMR